MIQETLKVKSSLEPTLASMFVQNATRFKSCIKIAVNTKTVNAKSIMGVVTLSILEGEQIKIIAEGEDEREAIDSLICFLNK